MDWAVDDPRVAAALVGGAAAVVVSLLGNIYAVWAARSSERRRRRERRVDVQTALMAEIRAYLHQLGGPEALRAHGEAVMAEMEDEEFHPFVPSERHDRVFETILGDIHILPTRTVEAVTFYYVQVTGIARLAEDLRSPEARALPHERRRRMYRHFIEMKQEALHLGGEARAALEAGIAQEARYRN